MHFISSAIQLHESYRERIYRYVYNPVLQAEIFTSKTEVRSDNRLGLNVLFKLEEKSTCLSFSIIKDPEEENSYLTCIYSMSQEESTTFWEVISIGHSKQSDVRG